MCPEPSSSTDAENAAGPPLVSRELQEVVNEGKVGGQALQQEVVQGTGGPLVVLVLSSTPRGGSTLLSDMLSNIQDSVLLFEPLWFIEKIDCFNDDECVTEYLGNVLACDFRLEFETWLKHKGLFFHFFSPEARRCLSDKNKEACIKDMKLRQLCKKARAVIVKVIRARLSMVYNLLQDPRFNLKVIHLTRDPRGSLTSIARFGWNADPRLRCNELHDDMKVYEEMRQAFPAAVMQVRYEQLCLKPLDTTSDIFRFLFDNATLPDSVRTYLKQHMLSSKKKGGNMSTIKNSTAEFESWRYKIDAKRLKDIEGEPVCEQAIRAMGHALFGSHKAVSDSRLPLILTNT